MRLFRYSFAPHNPRTRQVVWLSCLLALTALVFVIHDEGVKLRSLYEREISSRITDRNGALLQMLPNVRGAYMTQATNTPRVRELVVRSEDRYFYYHLGINPWSMLRSAWGYFFDSSHLGGSTITQQLVKNLYHQENDRTVANKLRESLAAIALELTTSKEKILSMYLDTAYFGDQIEGIEEASLHYFAKDANALADGEIVELLSLLSAPSYQPGSAGNTKRAQSLGKRIGVNDIPEYVKPPRTALVDKKDASMFELAGQALCMDSCRLTVDKELTRAIRTIVSENLAMPKFESVHNAAVVVIRVGRGDEPNQLLAVVGSANPRSSENGSQINMALASRPIGSTWKPFIYSKAIEKGARPYSLIDDNEYRYEIGTGYAFYPKNYDGMYRGEVTLNYALSNSLNVPAVRALSFYGVDAFSRYMEDSLVFVPKQDLDTYQLSIALGGLEMNPMLLGEYFTIFPRSGILAPLSLRDGLQLSVPMQRRLGMPTRVLAATTTQLMNKMLTDRLMGVEQFGLESNLNLPFQNYAVKTGTTYDYHDSWTVGYTPDIVVVTWIGNSDNKAMDLLSGARGAGKIWHDTMALLFAKGVISDRKFDESYIASVGTQEGESFGLEGDNIPFSRLVMKSQDIVLEPHDQDVIEWQEGMSIPLHAKESLIWEAGKERLGEGENLHFIPPHAGEYTIIVRQKDGSVVATLHLHVVDKE
jgi:penicillin-binding protein 1C